MYGASLPTSVGCGLFGADMKEEAVLAAHHVADTVAILRHGAKAAARAKVVFVVHKLGCEERGSSPKKKKK